jgi:hypothetical protein
MFKPGDKAYYVHEEDGKEYLVEVAMSIPGCYHDSDGYVVYLIDKFEAFGGHTFSTMDQEDIDFWVNDYSSTYDANISNRQHFSRLIRTKFLKLVDVKSSINNEPEEDRGGFHLI